MNRKNYSIIYLLRNKTNDCDHEWSLIHKDIDSKIIDWRCKYCAEMQTTYEISEKDKKFIGEF